MTEANPCARCEKPMRHDTAAVCGPCASHLRADLQRTAGLAGQVAITIARMDRITRTGSSQPDDLGWWRAGDDLDPRRPGTNLAVRVMTERSALEPIAMPPRIEASLAYRAAWNELATWARHCCEHRGIAYAQSGLDGLCGFLGGQVDWLRFRDEAGEAFDKLEAACRQVERIVDRRPEEILVGFCTADGEHRSRYLYVLPGKETAKCECGIDYEVARCREHLREQLRDQLMTAAEIAVWLVALGIAPSVPKVRKTINQWSVRGRIIDKTEIGGAPAYAFGAALDLAIEAYKGVAG